MAHTAVHLALRVARRIASLRRHRRLTQEQLAGRLDIAVKNVQRIESGKQNLTLNTITRIANALDVSDIAIFCDPPEQVDDVDLQLMLTPRPVPVLPLRQAARWIDTRATDHLEAWMLVSVADDTHFVCVVDDGAMEPLIPAGSWCLFRDGSFEVKNGGVFLVQQGRGEALVRRLRFVSDDEVVLERADGGDPLKLGAGWRDQWRVVAEWVLVLAAPTTGAMPAAAHHHETSSSTAVSGVGGVPAR